MKKSYGVVWVATPTGGALCPRCDVVHIWHPPHEDPVASILYGMAQDAVQLAHPDEAPVVLYVHQLGPDSWHTDLAVCVGADGAVHYLSSHGRGWTLV